MGVKKKGLRAAEDPLDTGVDAENKLLGLIVIICCIMAADDGIAVEDCCSCFCCFFCIFCCWDQSGMRPVM